MKIKRISSHVCTIFNVLTLKQVSYILTSALYRFSIGTSFAHIHCVLCNRIAAIYQQMVAKPLELIYLAIRIRVYVLHINSSSFACISIIFFLFIFHLVLPMGWSVNICVNIYKYICMPIVVWHHRT